MDTFGSLYIILVAPGHCCLDHEIVDRPRPSHADQLYNRVSPRLFSLGVSQSFLATRREESRSEIYKAQEDLRSTAWRERENVPDVPNICTAIQTAVSAVPDIREA